jgi:hypothetical protein
MIWLISCLMLTVPCLCCVCDLPEGHFPWTPDKRARYLRECKDTVCDNLRDLNLEGKDGRLPHVDYASLKSFLQDEATTQLAEIARLGTSSA